MLKSVLIIPLFFGLSFVLYPQSDTYHLQGIIRDRETKEPIPYASISIINSTRGTAANARGEFSLMIRSADRKDSIKISSIGFTSVVMALDRINPEETWMVELPPDIKLLQEIEINQKPMDPVEIIKSAIDSIRKNYRNEPFNLEFYSEMQATNALTNQEFTVESIITGYYPGYSNHVDKRFEIIKKRARGDNPLDVIDYPFWPTLEIHRADLIADPHKTGILNEKYITKFQYTYRGILTYDSDTLYHIDYVLPKPTEKITGYGIVPKVYRGSIYITTESNAIVKHEIVTDQFLYSIVYRKNEGYYFPYIIRGERILKGENMFTGVYNIVRLISMELNQVKVIDYQTNEFYNLSRLPDDQDYWDLHFPIDHK
jgi:hypothetical protein